MDVIGFFIGRLINHFFRKKKYFKAVVVVAGLIPYIGLIILLSK